MRRIGLAVLLVSGPLGMAIPTAAPAGVAIGISVNFAPPVLPVYVQPAIPAPGYFWVPGYWAWDEIAAAYYWVPGTWTLPPGAGLLWTPAWWGWGDGGYVFHSGYWGSQVGFYGGIAYGFGYTGSGYEGSYWRGGQLFYNRSVTNITNVNVTNVYNKTVVVQNNRTSFNGGPGGVRAAPTPAQQAVDREQRVPPTPAQQRHLSIAKADPRSFARANGGHPPVAASPRPLGDRAAAPPPDRAPRPDGGDRPPQDGREDARMPRVHDGAEPADARDRSMPPGMRGDAMVPEVRDRGDPMRPPREAEMQRDPMAGGMPRDGGRPETAKMPHDGGGPAAARMPGKPPRPPRPHPPKQPRPHEDDHHR